jgi:hypothetical protein
MLEGYIAKEQHSVVHFCWQKDSLQRIFIKKCFLFMVGSVYCIKLLTTESRSCHLGGRCFTDDEVETEVWKWLRLRCCGFQLAGKALDLVCQH